ncbi:MAG TPA: carboxyl transferase domain-containing protein [Acidimicrobiales bacterium]|nr:carboxyl transferase domain-containing protein [Acidimicrobiales bacterium]
MSAPTRYRRLRPPRQPTVAPKGTQPSPPSTAASFETIGGRPVSVFSISPTTGAGSLTPRDSDTIVAASRAALRYRVPLVGYVGSGGVDLATGIDGLHAWGRLARAVTECSGLVPVVMVVDGPAVSGPAMVLGLADVVVMTDPSYAFVSGPAMVRQLTGVRVEASGLGGAHIHARRTGLAAIEAPDRVAASEAVEELLSYLPANSDEAPPILASDDPTDRSCPELDDVVPSSPTGSYDVRAVLRAVVDEGELLELRPRWANQMVTALGRIGGQPVGLLANQPQALAGTLDIPASHKGARFVAFCDAFGLPIITFIDTPGFLPGKDLEWRGMIRHGAQLAFTYAEATVPRISVILRKAYGGAYIVMDSKRMGSDLCLAWPSAEVAVMGAKGAVQILHRGLSPEEAAAREADYEESYLNPWIAAERGLLDAVIEPADTRRVLAQGLDQVVAKRENVGRRKHSNIPL